MRLDWTLGGPFLYILYTKFFFFLNIAKGGEIFWASGILSKLKHENGVCSSSSSSSSRLLSGILIVCLCCCGIGQVEKSVYCVVDVYIN